ncbi:MULTISPECIES: hypothetical protein [Aerococcus]|nr:MULTISPECIES: hypothetical protein [Aerococcus]MDK6231451.1 hypothetical protein [Aerococcus urinae]MDK6258017.1 hypothetical protein [Aerococcus urinae]MDK6293746.1 hypothetical protein [Aerococcus urinae]MDK6626996.1 hypothetical protein [Aerococcus urinae]MDK6728463.1 hypothetical protein [Aerococcus urinae]
MCTYSYPDRIQVLVLMSRRLLLDPDSRAGVEDNDRASRKWHAL